MIKRIALSHSGTAENYSQLPLSIQTLRTGEILQRFSVQRSTWCSKCSSSYGFGPLVTESQKLTKKTRCTICTNWLKSLSGNSRRQPFQSNHTILQILCHFLIKANLRQNQHVHPYPSQLQYTNNYTKQWHLQKKFPLAMLQLPITQLSWVITQRAPAFPLR